MAQKVEIVDGVYPVRVTNRRRGLGRLSTADRRLHLRAGTLRNPASAGVLSAFSRDLAIMIGTPLLPSATVTSGGTPVPNMNGGCLCGDVRYSASGEPVVTSICHCRDCQRRTGSAFVEVVAVPKEAFSVQGRLQTFTNTGDSGRKLDRKFCPRCGSPVFVEAEGFPGMALIMGGTLDDTSWLKPTMALFCASAQPWLAITQEMKSFPRMPS